MAFASYCGVSHCLTVANGTDAIEIGLKALGISSNDLVATVANAGMYTTTSILNIGAKPYFMDVGLDTYNVTLNEVIDAVKKGVKAVVVTHLYGLAISEIMEIASFCKNNNIPLLEDCSQAHGAIVHNKHVGSFGDVSTFSFYPTKNLGGLGDGGAIVTPHNEIAEKVYYLRQYGWNEKYKVAHYGGRTSRLDEIQAAILLKLLPELDHMNIRRRAVALKYNNDIKNSNIHICQKSGNDYVAHLYVLQCKDRKNLIDYLNKHKISTDIHYPIPDHRQPVFQNTYKHITLKYTELLSSQILTIPCYPELDKNQINYIIETINSWQK